MLTEHIHKLALLSGRECSIIGFKKDVVSAFQCLNHALHLFFFFLHYALFNTFASFSVVSGSFS